VNVRSQPYAEPFVPDPPAHPAALGRALTLYIAASRSVVETAMQDKTSSRLSSTTRCW